MQRALELARQTVGLASPNPQVGCVIVRDNIMLGEGAHVYDHYDHAEIVALKLAAAHSLDVRGATAYVTLEPCGHHGRTGPCADALIAAGIQRVVAATFDPNPQVAGRGIARMQAAGIEVTTGVLQAEARELNDGFAHWIQTSRPLVTLKAALSVDGMLAPPATQRTAKQPHWLTGPAAREEVQRMRHASDAILTGIGTVLADDPLLTDRTNLPRRRPLLRIILDSHLRTPLDSQLVRTAADDVLIFCSPEADEPHAAALRNAGIEIERVEILSREGKPVMLDLLSVLNSLGRRKLLNLLLECGSQLNGAFLTQHLPERGLVDKLTLFYSETELGPAAIPFASGIGSPFLLEQSLSHLTRRTFANDACVTGYLRDPWTSSPPNALG